MRTITAPVSFLRPFAPVAIVLTLLSAGCNRTTPKANVAPGPEPLQQQDALEPALESLRQAHETRHFRDGLNQVNAHLNRADGKHDHHLTESAKTILKEQLHLDDAELEEVEARTFRPLDAAHLESCFLFSEIARSLDMSRLPPLDQAVAAFAWTVRAVVLHEQHDEGLPPHLVAKRGYGGPRDRALVFIELLRQLKLDAYVIALPGAKDEAQALLVGVRAPSDKGHQVALFDARLGLPVRDANRIATVEAVKANPQLLGADWKQAEIRLAFSLGSLAPRMLFLEEALASHDRVVLYEDAESLYKNAAAATGLPVGPWQGGTPPWRLARQFYGPDDGGADKTGRHQQFESQLISIALAIQEFRDLKLWVGSIPDDALARLLNITADLFTKFQRQPREMLLRGQHDAALVRLDRISEVLAQDRSAQHLDEARFQQDIAQWREKLVKFHFGKEQGNLERLWLDDQYLIAVMDVEGDRRPQQYAPKLLTHVMLRASRQPLGSTVDAIKAAIWEEKAEKLEARVLEQRRGDAKPTPLDDKIANAWRNTATAWGTFLDRADLGSARQRERLAKITEQFQTGQFEFALSALEQLHLDLSRIWDARIRQAQAQVRIGQSQAAAASLKLVQSSLQTLQNDSDLKKMMDQLASEQLAAPLARRIALLQRDWTPRGNFHWVGRRAEALLQTTAR